MKTRISTQNCTFVFAYVLLVAVIFCGCGEENITAKSTTKGGEVRTVNGIFTQIRKLGEFEYKGHTYISCNVRDGIAMTHAGHCWCNREPHN